MGKKIMGIFSVCGGIRTHDQQNYEILETGALAVAAMKSYIKVGHFTWGNSKIKTKNGWGKKGRVWILKFLSFGCLHFM